MTQSSAQPEDMRTIVYKTIVMGIEPDLQAGYVSGVSGESFSSQLFPSLGVTLGVTRCHIDEKTDYVFQLWSIPTHYEHGNILRKFYKGHKAVIIIVNHEDINGISDAITNLREDVTQAVLLLIVSDDPISEIEKREIDNILGQPLKLYSAEHLQDSIELLGVLLDEANREEKMKMGLVVLGIDECERFTSNVTRMTLPPVTDEELEIITEYARTQGITCIDESCSFDYPEGYISMDLRSGNVRLKPKTCHNCKRSCKRNAGICIIGVDNGWSTDDIGSRAMLILAKIHALSTRIIPNHVEKQIRYATSCKYYTPDGSEESIRIESELAIKGYVLKKENSDFLDVAKERLMQKKLPQTAFNSLKRAFNKIRSSIESE